MYEKPTNALAILDVLSVAFCDHPQGVQYNAQAVVL
jgi:hypothetical protein